MSKIKNFIAFLHFFLPSGFHNLSISSFQDSLILTGGSNGVDIEIPFRATHLVSYSQCLDQLASFHWLLPVDQHKKLLWARLWELQVYSKNWKYLASSIIILSFSKIKIVSSSLWHMYSSAMISFILFFLFYIIQSFIFVLYLKYNIITTPSSLSPFKPPTFPSLLLKSPFSFFFRCC